VVGSVPTINGQWTVKELGPVKFSVPVNVATAGTGGSFKRLRSVTPRHNQFDSISMQGTSGGLTYGWVSGGDPNWVIDGLDPAKQIPWVDGNNDFNFFTNVNIQNYVEAAFLIGHPQCYGNTFVNCLADGGPKSKVGLRKRGGHFQWLGGSMAGNAEVDFKIEHGFSIADRIQFCQSEGSARFIDQTNGNIGSLLVEGCRWTAGAIHPDREIVRWVSPDILSIRSCVLGYAQNPPGACKLAWRSNALQGAPGQQGAQRSVFEFRNNILVTTKSAVDPDAPVVLADCFSALPPTDMGGNMVMTDVLHLLAERMPEWFQNLTHNSATPEVGGYRHFNAANSAATSITNFIRGSEGQRLTLRFTNGNTTLVNGGTIRLAGAADFVGSANDLLELVLIGAVWHECNRSVN
jgi:hypothetical protein